MTKFVVCRPLGGLNDVLCQIQKCLKYAERYDRKVIVDTSYNPRFGNFVGNYFTSTNDRLHLAQVRFMIPTELTFPRVLDKNDYALTFDEKIGAYVTVNERIPVTFNFSRDYREEYLIHHQLGGGLKSASLLKHIEFTADILPEIKRIVSSHATSRYDAVHIRNSDYKSNYEVTLVKLIRKLKRALFIATDSEEVKIFSKKQASLCKHSDKVYFFKGSNDPVIDALADLTMLMRAQKLRVIPLVNVSPRYSGFSRLAKIGWLQISLMNKNLVSLSSLGGIADHRISIIRVMLNYFFYLPLAIKLSKHKKGLVFQIATLV